MGSSISKSQPVYPLQNPAFVPGINAYGYPQFGFSNPNQNDRKKDRVNSYGMHPPAGYSYPVYPNYLSSYQGYGYPAFPTAPPMPVPFIPPAPFVRAPTDPGPPLFMPTAAQNPNQSPVIPTSTRRRAATPHPSAFRGPELQPQPQPQVQRHTPDSDDTDPVIPLDRTNPAAFRSPDPLPIRNPLPPPPRDVYESTPYRELLNLPHTTALLTSSYGTVNQVPPRDNPVGRRKSLKGLLRTLSGGKKRRGEAPVPFMPVFMTQPQTTTAPPTTSMPAPPPAAAAGPSTAPVAPIRFSHDGTYAGFMNHSKNRIIYKNKTYPSALHLHEALKFIDHRPDLSEQIRNVAQVEDVYPLSASIQEFVRPDWGQIYLKTMEEVLYLKFKQHPELRTLLMNTGTAPLIYTEVTDSFWGEGPSGEGTNELGKALVRVRDRLRAEGQGI